MLNIYLQRQALLRSAQNYLRSPLEAEQWERPSLPAYLAEQGGVYTILVVPEGYF